MGADRRQQRRRDGSIVQSVSNKFKSKITKTQIYLNNYIFSAIKNLIINNYKSRQEKDQECNSNS